MSRNLRFLFSLICILALAGFVTTGCEVDDGADAGTTTTPDTTTTSSGDTTMTTPPAASYFFVRVQTGAGVDPGEAQREDPGADIDYVGLIKDGTLVNPNAISLETDTSQFPNFKTRAADAGLTINSFSESDPTAVTADSTCDTGSDNYVSVGMDGDPGAIWTFPQAIEEGDTIVVLEVGGCVRASGGATPGSEPYNIDVSVANSPDSNWVPIGSRANDAPLSTLTVPSLPRVELTP